MNIFSAASNTINVTGAVNITGFDTIAAGATRRLIFSGACPITHNPTSLILPGGANVTTAPGDVLEFQSLGGGNAKCIGYTKADGTAAVGPPPATIPAPIRTRIINGAMQHSQERGNVLVDVTTGAVYVVDQWRAILSTTPGGTLRAQRVQSVTPAGALNRLRFTVQVADASIAAGDFYAISQPIEGSMVADALFGSASARTIIVRLGVSSSQAGTYTVALRNGASNRSWLGSITIAPGEINIDLVRTVVLTGDTTGTWLTDTGLGMDLSICLAAGSTFQGAAGWSAGNFLATSSQTNFMATGGATFELFDVGHYVDVNAVGIAPTYEVPRFDDELRRCRRYWKNLRAAVQTSFSMTIVHDPQLVSVPAVSGGGAGFALTWNFTNSCGFSQTTAAQQDLVFNSRY
jgi:hypothetical protein